MKNTARTGLALALSGVALPLYAQAPVPYTETRPYISAMYAYTPAPNDTTLKHGDGVDIAAGKALSRYWGVEVDAFRNTFDGANNGGNRAYSEQGAKGNVMFFFSRRPEFSPYIGVGGGAIHGKNNLIGGVTDSAGIVDVGLGFMKFFTLGTQELGFRADARYRWTFLDDDSQLDAGIRLNNPVVKVGLVAPLGPKPVALIEPPPPPPPVIEPPRDVDTDGDGVVDRLDQCPGTPLGVPVDARGCPLPVAPPPPPPVPMSYCNQKLEPVYFAFDRSELTPAARATLNRNIVKINDLAGSGQCNDSSVDLEGNTDSIGTEAYNQALSERRANVVRRYMEGKVRVRLRTVANGENRPVATNDTDEGRAQNRRTEVNTRGTQR